MENKKVQLNCWINPAIKASLERFAVEEDRRVGNLGGLLIEWAYKQLERAGNSMTLKTWTAIPSGQTEALEQFNKQHEELTHGTRAKSKKKAS